LSPWQPLLSVVREKGVCTTLDSACHYKEKESKFGESLRTQSASLRLYVKETVTRIGALPEKWASIED
jgi:hypothetical protein